jgi:IS1 family transposase
MNRIVLKVPHIEAKVDDVCAYYSVAMLTNYLSKPQKTEKMEGFGQDKHNIVKVTPQSYINIFEQHNPNYSMRVHSPEKSAIKRYIISQLSKGIPVPFLYIICYRSKFLENFHYSIVSGMKQNGRKLMLKLSDSRMPIETDEWITYEEFLQRIYFKNPTAISLSSMATFFVKKPTLFHIEKKTSLNGLTIMQPDTQKALHDLQKALGVLIFFPILYKPELINKDYEEYQTSQVRKCARRLMTMNTFENEAGYPPDKIFVTDWQKTERSRLVVQFAIDKIMDKYLPSSYTQEHFASIAQQIFDYFLGDAIRSCLKLNTRFDMSAIKKFFYSEIAEDWVERTDNPIMKRKVKFTVQEALTKQGAYKPVDYEQNELAKKYYDEVVQQVIDCLLDMARKEGKKLASPTAEVGKPKEAWEMTYKEVERDFYDSLFEQFKRIVTDYFGWGNKEAQTKKDKKREYILANYKFLKFLPNNFDDDDLMRFTYEILQDKEIDRQLRDKIQEFRNFEVSAASTYGRDRSWHKEQIKKAMVSGKIIPKNVLSQYPELQNEALPKFKEGDMVVAPNWREPNLVYKVMSVKYTHKGTYAYTLWAEGIPIQNADESQLDFANGLGAILDDIGFTISSKDLQRGKAYIMANDGFTPDNFENQRTARIYIFLGSQKVQEWQQDGGSTYVNEFDKFAEVFFDKHIKYAHVEIYDTSFEAKYSRSYKYREVNDADLENIFSKMALKMKLDIKWSPSIIYLNEIQKKYMDYALAQITRQLKSLTPKSTTSTKNEIFVESDTGIYRVEHQENDTLIFQTETLDDTPITTMKRKYFNELVKKGDLKYVTKDKVKQKNAETLYDRVNHLKAIGGTKRKQIGNVPLPTHF